MKMTALVDNPVANQTGIKRGDVFEVDPQFERALIALGKAEHPKPSAKPSAEYDTRVIETGNKAMRVKKQALEAEK